MTEALPSTHHWVSVKLMPVDVTLYQNEMFHAEVPERQADHDAEIICSICYTHAAIDNLYQPCPGPSIPDLPTNIDWGNT